MEAAQTAQAVPIAERLRNIKIGSYTVDNGSHMKHIAVRAICEEAAAEIERSHQREAMMKGECLLLADVLRDAFEVVKTVEGEDTDEELDGRVVVVDDDRDELEERHGARLASGATGRNRRGRSRRAVDGRRR